MKKVLTLMCAVFLCVICAMGLTACGEGKIVKAEVVSGFETTIAKGEELNTDDIHVRLTYSSKKTKDITSADLEFGDIDTSTTGTKDLLVTYVETGYEFTIKIKVVEDQADVNEIVNLSSTLWTEHLAYKKEQSNKENEFYDRTQPLYVGDDNTFNFRLSASGLNSYGEIVRNLKSVRTNVVVKLVEGQNKTELTGEDLAQYVSVNSINAELDFTEAAIGKVFEVTVSATNMAEGYPASQTRFTATLHVIDGFNVYDAQDLSVYDNKYQYYADRDNNARNHYGYEAIHQAVAEKYGLTKEEVESVKAVILQNNIIIEDKDVPAEFFWQIEPSGWASKTNLKVKGSLINYDHEGIYYRFVEHDEDFKFIGNYFGIDASRISKSVIETSNPSNTDCPFVCTTEGSESNIKVTCEALFYTTGIDHSQTGLEEQEGARVTWMNINFFGNGNLNADPRNSGALLLSKFSKAEMKAYNNITRSFLISYLVREYNDNYQGNSATFWIDHCKGYECYQCHIYIAGTNDGTIISDSEFRRANGPAIMVDYILDRDDSSRCVPSYVNIINSRIESLITGSEPWLKTYGADALVSYVQTFNTYFTGDAQLPGSNDNFPDTGKTFVLNPEQGVSQMNCAVYVKADTSNPLEPNRIGGYVRFFDSWEQYEAQDANYANLQQTCLSVLATASQYLDLSSEEKEELLSETIPAAIGQAAQAAGRELSQTEMLAVALQTAMEVFQTKLTEKVGTAIYNAGLDQSDPDNQAQIVALTMQTILTQATVENGGVTALGAFLHDFAGLEDQELQMMSLVAYISSVQQVIASDPDHDMPVFGLDFESDFNWAGNVGIADAAYGQGSFMQSHTSGGYLSALGILTCLPMGDVWAGGANYFDGKYLNLYHEAGFGIIIELFETNN